MSRFLADNDQPGQLVLTLYGQLGAGMTQGTFVSGEGAGVAPVRGEYYRKMYRPPNSTSNSTFLQTLRLLLVHETRAESGTPHGLRLAHATPRSWLMPGKEIVVRSAPTSFGPVSFSIRSLARTALVSLEVPPGRGSSHCFAAPASAPEPDHRRAGRRAPIRSLRSENGDD